MGGWRLLTSKARLPVEESQLLTRLAVFRRFAPGWSLCIKRQYR